MKLRCKHSWGQPRQHYNPPPHLKNVRGENEELIRMALFGITTIAQECIRCGYVDYREVTGMVTK